MTEDLAAILASGLVLGSLYALMGSGLSLVWGTLRVFNFAHGVTMMVAAYVTWQVTDTLGSDTAALSAAIVAGLCTGALAGAITERLLVRPFLDRSHHDLVVIITTLAGALIVQNLAQTVWGPRFKQVPELASGSVIVFGTGVDWHQIIIIILAPTTLLVVAGLLKYTKLGTAVRAIEQNRQAALLTGIDSAQVFRLTFSISGVLAALAGVLLAGFLFLSPTFGSEPLVKAFIVVMIGGLGSLTGTVIAAYLVGIVEALSTFYISSFYAPVVLFGLVIVMMMIRPTGLRGGVA